VLYAEPLLLVDYEQAQVLWDNVVLQEAVGPDQDVDAP